MEHRDALEALADWLGALAHPDRLGLVLALADGEQNVATLAETLSLPQPRTSQHLALLRAHDIVEARREGRRVCYHLADPSLVEWIATGAGYLAASADRRRDLGDLLERLGRD